jgi:hypothetical protein
METSLNEGNRVIDAHARLVACDHRLDKIAAGSSTLLAERKRRRQYFAWMKRLGADVGVVQVEGAPDAPQKDACGNGSCGSRQKITTFHECLRYEIAACYRSANAV